MKHLKWFTLSFIIIELFLWISILFFDYHLPSGSLHYLSIIICAIYVLITYQKTKDHTFLILAFSATLVADYFLTLMQTHQLLGTFFFFLVQIFYFMRLIHMYKNKFYLVYMFSFIILSIFIIIITHTFDWLILVSVLYFTILSCNMIFAFKKYRIILLLAIALLLQIGADLFVAMHAGLVYVDLNQIPLFYTLLHLPINMIWLFYIPAQTLFALSATYNHLPKGESYV